MHILAQNIRKRGRCSKLSIQPCPLFQRDSGSHSSWLLIRQLAPSSSSRQWAGSLLQPGDNRDNAAASCTGHAIGQLGTIAAEQQSVLILLLADSALWSKGRALQNALHLCFSYLVIIPAGFASIVSHYASYALGASFSVVTDIAGSVA